MIGGIDSGGRQRVALSDVYRMYKTSYTVG